MPLSTINGDPKFPKVSELAFIGINETTQKTIKNEY